jgi:hypothetical protein
MSVVIFLKSDSICPGFAAADVFEAAFELDTAVFVGLLAAVFELAPEQEIIDSAAKQKMVRKSNLLITIFSYLRDACGQEQIEPLPHRLDSGSLNKWK